MKEGTQRSLPFIVGRHLWIIIGVIVLLCVVGAWLRSVIENVSNRGKYEIAISADGSKDYVLNTHTGKSERLLEGIPATSYEIVMAGDGSKAYILDTRIGNVWEVTQGGMFSRGYCR